MKIKSFMQVVLFTLALILLSGCASTPVANDPAALVINFQQSIERVHIAAVDALVVTGFDIKKQEPEYVEGFRPPKMGLVVGSGGETVGIWLTEQGVNETRVTIDTAKSFVGIIGQRNWNTQVMDEMTKALTK